MENEQTILVTDNTSILSSEQLSELSQLESIPVDDASLNTSIEDIYAKMTLKELLHPARYQDEPFESYKARRKASNYGIKQRIKRGVQLIHQSVTFHDIVKKHTYRKPKENV